MGLLGPQTKSSRSTFKSGLYAVWLLIFIFAVPQACQSLVILFCLILSTYVLETHNQVRNFMRISHRVGSERRSSAADVYLIIS